MKKLRLWAMALVSLVAVSALTGCGGSNDPVSPPKPNPSPTEEKTQPVTAVTVTLPEDKTAEGKLELPDDGGAFSIPIYFTPKGSTVTNLKATSSNPEVATAAIQKAATKDEAAPDATLTITPVAVGEATIAIEADAAKSEFKVAVTRSEPVEVLPVFVATGDASEITSYCADFTITLLETASYPAYEDIQAGVCFSSTNNTPQVPDEEGDYDTKQAEVYLKLGVADGDYSGTMGDLQAKTTYYYRAFLTLDDQTYYGEVKNFTTETAPAIAVTGTIDLGDGLLLAACNVGASKPEEAGIYVSWGETEPKKSYFSGSSYLKRNDYNGDEWAGATLFPEDDVATVVLGNEWRLPTETEMKFIKMCASRYVYNGVEGRIIRGENGQQAFMPAAGYKVDTSHNDYGERQRSDGSPVYGMAYWTSTRDHSNENAASSWYSEATIMSGTAVVGDLLDTNSWRHQGLTVRAVKRPNVQVSGGAAASTSTHGATLKADVDMASLPSSKVEKWGFLLSTTENTRNGVEVLAQGTPSGGEMKASVSELYSGVTYWAQPFVKGVNDGWYFGETFSFSTQTEEVAQWVDMGVSVMWASWNVGAEKPGQRGNLYAWGEVEPKDEYTYENNRYYNNYYSEGEKNLSSNRPYTKYNTKDGKTELEPEDDPAHVAWGDGARVPTQAEWKELCENCTRETVMCAGTMCEVYTSKTTGQTLFFPSREDRYNSPYYWSSTLRIDGGAQYKYYRYAYLVALYYSNSSAYTSIHDRYDGEMVRAVKPRT